MTPDELAEALAGVPEHELLEAFTTALKRRAEAPETPAIDPAEVALLELATPQTPPPASDEDEELYQQLFGPPAYTPLADDDRKNYEALYGPGTGGDAA